MIGPSHPGGKSLKAILWGGSKKMCQQQQKTKGACGLRNLELGSRKLRGRNTPRVSDSLEHPPHRTIPIIVYLSVLYKRLRREMIKRKRF